MGPGCDLLQIRQSSTTFKSLSLETVKIKENRLNKRGKSAGRNRSKQKYLDTNTTTESDCQALLNKKPGQNFREKIRILLINAQSIKNKDITLAEYMCVVTETWWLKTLMRWMIG